MIIEPSPTAISNPDLVFDQASHIYRYKGRLIPNTTWVLRAVGVIDDCYYSNSGLVRGSVVHRECELLAKGLLDWSLVDERVVGYVRAYERFVKESGFVPKIIETPVVNETYLYGTKPDQIGMISDKWKVVELKTGKVPKWVGLQTVAQGMAVFPKNWMNVGRIALELKPDGSYDPQELDDTDDGPTFLGMLGTSIWKLNNKYAALEAAV